MLRPIVLADEGKHGQWCLDRASRDESDLGGVIDQLVEHERQKVHEHQFGYRAHSAYRSADRSPENTLFANRRIANALAAKAIEETPRDTEDAPHQPDVFA